MENKSDDKFYQYYKSFLQDIIISFPEYKDSIIENHASLLRTNYPVSEKKRAKCNKWRETVFKYCLDNGKLIAEKNSEVFTKDEAKKCLGRNIEFNSIWTSNITESTREQLWNYLQTFYMLAVSDNTDSDLSSLFKNFSDTLEGGTASNDAMMANLKNITENIEKTHKVLSFALYVRWGSLDGRKILLQGRGSFSRPGEPILRKSCFHNLWTPASTLGYGPDPNP